MRGVIGALREACSGSLPFCYLLSGVSHMLQSSLLARYSQAVAYTQSYPLKSWTNERYANYILGFHFSCASVYLPIFLEPPPPSSSQLGMSTTVTTGTYALPDVMSHIRATPATYFNRTSSSFPPSPHPKTIQRPPSARTTKPQNNQPNHGDRPAHRPSPAIHHPLLPQPQPQRIRLPRPLDDAPRPPRTGMARPPRRPQIHPGTPPSLSPPPFPFPLSLPFPVPAPQPIHNYTPLRASKYHTPSSTRNLALSLSGNLSKGNLEAYDGFVELLVRGDDFGCLERAVGGRRGVGRWGRWRKGGLLIWRGVG